MKTAFAWALFWSVFSARADVSLKVRVKSGDSPATETTLLNQGVRERIDHGDGIVIIRQPDQRRIIVIDEQVRTYAFLQTASAPSARSGAAGKPAKGGVVKVTSDIVDTGERRQFFGFSARRIKSIVTAEPSPTACERTKSWVETDGWYIDFPGEANLAAAESGYGVEEGCHDTYEVTQNGTGTIGYPISYTTKTWHGDAAEISVSTYEVLEFSRGTLDRALFDVPPGYTLAADSRELTTQAVAAAEPKGSSTRRVGVVASDDISAPLRSFISTPTIQTVALTDPKQAARAHCDFILTVGVAAAAGVTAPPKRRGLLESLSRVAPVLDTSEAPAVTYRLIRVSDGAEVLKGSETGKPAGFTLRSALQLASTIEQNAVLARAISGKYPALRNLEYVFQRIQAQAGAETPLSLYGGLSGYHAAIVAMQYAAAVSVHSDGSSARALQPTLEKLGNAVRAALAQ